MDSTSHIQKTGEHVHGSKLVLFAANSAVNRGVSHLAVCLPQTFIDQRMEMDTVWIITGVIIMCSVRQTRPLGLISPGLNFHSRDRPLIAFLSKTLTCKCSNNTAFNPV